MKWARIVSDAQRALDLMDNGCRKKTEGNNASRRDADLLGSGCRTREGGSAQRPGAAEEGAGAVARAPAGASGGAGEEGGGGGRRSVELTVNAAASVRDLTVDDAVELHDDDVALLEESVDFETSGRSCCILSRQNWLRRKVFAFVTASIGDRCKPQPEQLIVCAINVEDTSGRSSYRDTTGSVLHFFCLP